MKDAWRHFISEFIGTFALVFVGSGAIIRVAASGGSLGEIAIGLTIDADILVIGPYTGASMNPARSFGPAVVSHAFEAQAVYWIGPLIGAVAAGVLYDRVFLRRVREPVDHGAVAP